MERADNAGLCPGRAIPKNGSEPTEPQPPAKADASASPRA